MTSQLATVAGGISTMAAGMAGSKLLPLIADAVTDPLPVWMQYLLGPLGALAGMIVAIWWLSQRLNKAEAKAEKREDERDADRKILITALDQNSTALREVSSVISRCKGSNP